jgi:hypothetical protein
MNVVAVVALVLLMLRALVGAVSDGTVPVCVFLSWLVMRLPLTTLLKIQGHETRVVIILRAEGLPRPSK